jgi:hypothetical protein
MARPLNKKAIQDRIKTSKKIMKEEKLVVTKALVAASKGETIDPVGTRIALAKFIKSSKAFNSDNIKLNSIIE